MDKKYLHLSDYVGQEMLIKLYEFLNAYPKEQLIISMTSSGGSLSVSEMITVALQEHKERTELIGLLELQSAAFDIFWSFGGKRYISSNFIGMIHSPSTDFTFVNDKPKKGQEECRFRINKAVFENARNMYKNVLTEEELKLYDNDECIYFDAQETKELFERVGDYNLTIL